MDLTHANTIGGMVEKYGLATVLVILIVGFILYQLWPYIRTRNDSQDKRESERENTLLKRLFDTTDAQVSLTKEVSKNMAEGNVLLSTLGHHMSSTASAVENLAKRLEVSDAKIEERHTQNQQNMQRMFDMWEDIHTALVQNQGDNRNILQKHESGERVAKKSVTVKEVLA